jgi:hypothetical protein
MHANRNMRLRGVAVDAATTGVRLSLTVDSLAIGSAVIRITLGLDIFVVDSDGFLDLGIERLGVRQTGRVASVNHSAEFKVSIVNLQAQ